MMRGGVGGVDEYQYYGAPHGLLMAVVLGLVVAGPLFMGGDGGGGVTAAVAELLGPTGLLLLPVCLVLVIRVLSSERGAAALADALSLGGSPDSVHRVGGSPVGVALALALIVVLLYYRTSLFGGGGGDDE
jgi:hypothetical protein